MLWIGIPAEVVLLWLSIPVDGAAAQNSTSIHPSIYPFRLLEFTFTVASSTEASWWRLCSRRGKIKH